MSASGTMTYFYRSIDKDAVKAFIYEDLKVLGIKIPKLDKIAKAAATAACASYPQSAGFGVNASELQQELDRGDHAVFGVPISLMDSLEDPNIGHIPRYLIQTRRYLSNHLNVEGIFRKTGSVSRQKELYQQLENDGGTSMDDAPVTDVTGLLKQFFRDLPEPLIPLILQDAFVQAAQLTSPDSKVYSLTLLCLLFPLEHITVFRYILEILYDVASNSKVNKMTANNLAVVLAPNIFQMKLQTKHLKQLTEALEVCINNVINIGVIPPSITEKVVMLRSLEDHADDIVSASSVDASSTSSGYGSSSLRKKKRSGSLQGFVGSIRRSVERLRSRVSRRSSSVPENLNMLQQSEGSSSRILQFHDNTGGDANPAIPQIMKRNDSGIDTSSLLSNRRRVILNENSLLGNASIQLESRGSDSVFESPEESLGDTMNFSTNLIMPALNSTSNQTMCSVHPLTNRTMPISTATANQTMYSMNSRNDSSRPSTPSKKKSWTSHKSPFAKRKRSVSAGPSYSPSRSRSSSRTKKLIRRLSGGTKKTPDMVGQRLAFSTDDDVELARERIPSAPVSISLGRGASRNEEPASSVGFIPDNAEKSYGEGEMISRTQSVRQSRRSRISARKRTNSADSRSLKRGRPNNELTGLGNVRRPAKLVQESSTGSLHPHTAENLIFNGEADMKHSDQSQQLHDHARDTIDFYHQSDALKMNSQSSIGSGKVMETDLDNFSSRMEEVANAHAAIFKPPRHSQSGNSGKSRPQRAATFSGNHVTERPPLPEKLRRGNSNMLDKPVETIHTSSTKPCTGSMSSIGSAISSSSATQHRAASVSSMGSVSSKSSLDSRADSGVGQEVSSSSGSSLLGITERDLPPSSQRIVVGGNADSTTNRYETEYADPQKLLKIRGAALQKMTHADSLADLHGASKVKESKKAFDQPFKIPESTAEKTVAKPPRQAPVRIPTVFARNDPRAMRYKMAADAVRRRSLQKSENAAVMAPPGSDPQVNDAVARVKVSLRTCHSPPQRRISTIPSGYFRQSARGTAHIPISTDVVKEVVDKAIPADSKTPTLSERPPLREHSPNINFAPTATSNTPKIKSAMLPLDRRLKTTIRSSGAASSSSEYKSPRSHSASKHRPSPYHTGSTSNTPRHRPSAI